MKLWCVSLVKDTECVFCFLHLLRNSMIEVLEIVQCDYLKCLVGFLSVPYLSPDNYIEKFIVEHERFHLLLITANWWKSFSFCDGKRFACQPKDPGFKSHLTTSLRYILRYLDLFQGYTYERWWYLQTNTPTTMKLGIHMAPVISINILRFGFHGNILAGKFGFYGNKIKHFL